VPFQINPHFIDFPLPDETAETRVDRINEFLAVNPGIYVAGMRDGTMLRIDGASIKVEGAGRVCIFVKDQAPVEFGPGDSLPFLQDEGSEPILSPVSPFEHAYAGSSPRRPGSLR